MKRIKKSIGLPVRSFRELVDWIECDDPFVASLLGPGSSAEPETGNWIRLAWPNRKTRLVIRWVALILFALLFFLYERSRGLAQGCFLIASYSTLFLGCFQMARDWPTASKRVARAIAYGIWLGALLLLAIAFMILWPFQSAPSDIRPAILMGVAIFVQLAHRALASASAGRGPLRRLRRSASMATHLISVGLILSAALSLVLHVFQPRVEAGGVGFAGLVVTFGGIYAASVTTSLHRKRRVKTIALAQADQCLLLLTRTASLDVDESDAYAALLRLESALASGIDVGARTFRSPLETASYRLTLSGVANLALDHRFPGQTPAIERVEQAAAGLCWSEKERARKHMREILVAELWQLRTELSDDVDVAA